ncbi:MAG: hypothetical protein IPK60_21240 [Sandaracinaceae bacterium]|nr:hypothetical protein [Sandaracinaceae bacterium]
MKASFLVKFTDANAAHRDHPSPEHRELVAPHSDASVVEAWLSARGFVKSAPEAQDADVAPAAAFA